MTGNEYQQNVMGFKVNYPENLGPICPIFRMIDKLGNVSSTMVDILNKPDAAITNKEREMLLNELAEVLEYLTRTIYHSGLTLDNVMQRSVDMNNVKTHKDLILKADIFNRK